MPLFGCSTLSQSRIEEEVKSAPVAGSMTQPAPAPALKVVVDGTASKDQRVQETSRPQTNGRLSDETLPSSRTHTMTPSSPFASPPITLIVGGPLSPSPLTPQTTFYVHAALLTNISSFFRAALDTHNSQAGFLEASTLIMRLPDQRLEDVAFLMQWLYHPRGGKVAQSLACDSVDGPVGEMERWKRERVDGRDQVGPRPGPPAFGPLLRLFILADRLGVRGGLRGQICERVEEVGELAAAVPSKDDVWRLWDGVPRYGGSGVEGAAGTEGREEDLKSVVLEMYANMRGWAVFEEGETSEEEFDWHPMFMRALVVRLLREKREVREVVRSKESRCKCEDIKAAGVGKEGAKVG